MYLVESIPSRSNVTLTAIMDIYKGAKTAKIKSEGFDLLAQYGAGKHYSKTGKYDSFNFK
jgi:superfamily II DNA helicase RecQ